MNQKSLFENTDAEHGVFGKWTSGLDSGWQQAVVEQARKPYFLDLMQFVELQRTLGDVFPPAEMEFRALQLVPLRKVKFVILGQDPYHDNGQAHGLSFSVPDGIRFPPSLSNIFKELVSDVGCDHPVSGNLEPWARQGGLLLNTVLTVRAHQANSHRDHGWEEFTDAMISRVSKNCDHVAFVLWGKPAGRKKKLIDESRHLIIESPHPSPLSAHRGFFGSKPFSRINEFLLSHGNQPIQWQLLTSQQ